MAWLNATPKPDARSKRAAQAETGTLLSRLDQLKRDKVAPAMPPNPAPHIIERLIDIGLTEAAGMGAGPLSWREIVAWQEANWIRLAPWEARLIRDLSKAHLAETRRAEDESCPPPWRTPVTQAELDAAERRLEALLG